MHGAARLLWTGGWDSTYRLLDLLLVKRWPVEPWYLIDPARPSTGAELRAMREVKDRVLARHPAAAALLAPTRYREIHEVRPFPAITAAFERIRRGSLIGGQYEWLARFAEEEAIDGLEMSVADRDGRVFRVLQPWLVRAGPPEDPWFAVSPGCTDPDFLAVFRRFRFPVFGMKKPDMSVAARRAGFHDLLERTVFCHRPRADGTACGVCNPCVCAMQEGMSWRLPLLSRLRYHLSAPRRRRGAARERRRAASA